MRVAIVVAAALLVAGCGTKKPTAYERANLALLDVVPVYPGAAAPKTTTSGAAQTTFGARDWTLPAAATERVVIAWYERALARRGWKVVGESFGTVRATRRGAALTVGVRGRTLEAIANSRGG